VATVGQLHLLCLLAGTKIMATIGPSIHDTDILAKLLEAGMAAGRVDLTWGEKH